HSHTVLFFFSPHRHPPPPPLFPYTTLFRSPSPASASASANPTPARPGPMIPTTWGGNLIPQERRRLCRGQGEEILGRLGAARQRDRKSTRLNSSHVSISYAVFCLKKKKTKT